MGAADARFRRRDCQFRGRHAGRRAPMTEQRPGTLPSERQRHAGTHPNSRPKDAGILIVIRRDGDTNRLLMGRRSGRHAFMPNLVVFPGGRVDRADHFGPSADKLPEPVLSRLLSRTPANMTPRRARAIALSAIRETCEETGLLLGQRSDGSKSVRNTVWRPFIDQDLLPSLSGLRLIARAITPPRRNRRFDARFFATFADQIGGQVTSSDDELGEVAWLTFDEARASDLPGITELILDHLESRLDADPYLQDDTEIPFHFMRYGQFCCDMI
jgi:8-oxo-dGTP pyrophosphatase MutT (NUDIX family)